MTTRRAAPLSSMRKQPLQRRAESTVAVLLEAAAQVLETAGLEGYNTNAVAARAGVSIGTLYQYFSNKDALTVALMRREEAVFRDEWLAALAEAQGYGALRRCIEAAVRQQLERPRLAHLLDVEEGRPEMQRALAKDSRSFRARLEDVLCRPDLPQQARPDIAAADIGAMIRGLTDGAGERGEKDRAYLASRVTAAVFGYLQGMAVEPGVCPNLSKPKTRRR